MERSAAPAARGTLSPASSTPGSEQLRELCEQNRAAPVRQLSYHYNMNYGTGAVLPLRLPSMRAGAGGVGAPTAKRPSAAYLESGTTTGQEAAR